MKISRYNEEEYLNKIFELIGSVKKYQRKAEKYFLRIKMYREKGFKEEKEKKDLVKTEQALTKIE